MLSLTEKLLSAAGFRRSPVEDTWALADHPRPVVTVECNADGSHIMDALLDIHAALEATGLTYTNFAIRDGYLSVVGLRRAQVAAVA